MQRIRDIVLICAGSEITYVTTVSIWRLSFIGIGNRELSLCSWDRACSEQEAETKGKRKIQLPKKNHTMSQPNTTTNPRTNKQTKTHRKMSSCLCAHSRLMSLLQKYQVPKKGPKTPRNPRKQNSRVIRFLSLHSVIVHGLLSQNWFVAPMQQSFFF